MLNYLNICLTDKCNDLEKERHPRVQIRLSIVGLFMLSCSKDLQTVRTYIVCMVHLFNCSQAFSTVRTIVCMVHLFNCSQYFSLYPLDASCLFKTTFNYNLDTILFLPSPFLTGSVLPVFSFSFESC